MKTAPRKNHGAFAPASRLLSYQEYERMAFEVLKFCVRKLLDLTTSGNEITLFPGVLQQKDISWPTKSTCELLVRKIEDQRAQLQVGGILPPKEFEVSICWYEKGLRGKERTYDLKVLFSTSHTEHLGKPKALPKQPQAIPPLPSSPVTPKTKVWAVRNALSLFVLVSVDERDRSHVWIEGRWVLTEDKNHPLAKTFGSQALALIGAEEMGFAPQWPKGARR